MWNPLKASSSECDRFRESLEELAAGEGPRMALREHVSACQDCRAGLDELVTSGELLNALPRQAAVGPWFAPRVMAAIAAARESELRRSIASMPRPPAAAGS